MSGAPDEGEPPVEFPRLSTRGNLPFSFSEAPMLQPTGTAQSSGFSADSSHGGLPEIDDKDIHRALAASVSPPLSAREDIPKRKSIADVAKSWERGSRDFRTGDTQVFQNEPRKSQAHANIERKQSGVIPQKVEWAQFQELLQKPPADAARILSRAAKRLAQGTQDLRQTQLLRLASDFGNAQTATQVQFIKHLHGGFAALPSEDKLEAVCLAAYMSRAVTGVCGEALQLEDFAQGDRIDGETLQLLQDAAKALAKEARLYDLDTEKQATLREVIEEESHSASPSERNAPSASAAQANAPSASAAQAVSFASPPERSAPSASAAPVADVEGIAAALRTADAARAHVWMVLGLPALELLLAAALGQRSCGNYLVAWLAWDALLGLALALLAYLTSRMLEPAYEKLRADPARTSQSWGEWWYHGKGELTAECHGLEREGFRLVAAALAMCLVFLILGVFWALFGVLELIVAFLSICVGLPFVLAAFFMAVRLAIPVGLVIHTFPSVFAWAYPSSGQRGDLGKLAAMPQPEASTVRAEDAKSR